jgi:hypothetical protein
MSFLYKNKNGIFLHLKRHTSDPPKLLEVSLEYGYCSYVSSPTPLPQTLLSLWLKNGKCHIFSGASHSQFQEKEPPNSVAFYLITEIFEVF